MSTNQPSYGYDKNGNKIKGFLTTGSSRKDGLIAIAVGIIILGLAPAAYFASHPTSVQTTSSQTIESSTQVESSSSLTSGSSSSTTDESSGNSGTTTKTATMETTEDLAREIIAKGNWGVGQARIDKLTAAGYDAKDVQAKINELMK